VKAKVRVVVDLAVVPEEVTEVKVSGTYEEAMAAPLLTSTTIPYSFLAT